MLLTAGALVMALIMLLRANSMYERSWAILQFTLKALLHEGDEEDSDRKVYQEKNEQSEN